MRNLNKLDSHRCVHASVIGALTLSVMSKATLSHHVKLCGTSQIDHQGRHQVYLTTGAEVFTDPTHAVALLYLFDNIACNFDFAIAEGFLIVSNLALKIAKRLQSLGRSSDDLLGHIDCHCNLADASTRITATRNQPARGTTRPFLVPLSS